MGLIMALHFTPSPLLSESNAGQVLSAVLIPAPGATTFTVKSAFPRGDCFEGCVCGVYFQVYPAVTKGQEFSAVEPNLAKTVSLKILA